jgi:hypothetical protein
MIFRYLAIEAIEFFAKPLYWVGLIFVSMFVLAGLDQLALDRSVVKVLIVDSEPGQSEGLYLRSLVTELSGIDAVVKPAVGGLDALIDNTNADIVLSKLSSSWQASLRPRSILDHRRLARVGFAIAAVINRRTPWESVISAETVSPTNYGRAACDVGERICSVLRAIGDPHLADLCTTPSDYQAENGYPFDSTGTTPCKNKSDIVLKNALGFDFDLKKFCQSDLIDEDRSRGLCSSEKVPTLGSVVSLITDPQTHTRVFIPRTICLLAVFIAFIVSGRSMMQETRNNTLAVITAISHGRVGLLIISKLFVTLSFVMLLVLILLELSSMRFDISIKPGLISVLIPVAVGALSSAILGLVIALLVRNEVAVYAIGSMYLLILFILSGYIDDLKETSSFFSIFSYILPLKDMIAPFSSWMIFGISPSAGEIVLPNLLPQFLGSFVLLLWATDYYRRSS